MWFWWAILFALIIAVATWWFLRGRKSDLEKHYVHLQGKVDLVKLSRAEFADHVKTHNPAPQKILMISGGVWDKPRFYVSVTGNRLKAYCQQHNYDCLVFDSLQDPERALYWQKISAVRNALKTNRYDAVVWVDDDIYITNPNVRVEHFLGLAPEKHVLISNEVAFPMNTGMFVARNTPQGHKVMDTVWGSYDQFPQRHTDKYHEQDIFQHFYFTRFREEVGVFSRNLLQTVHVTQPHQPGDFCVHFAGILPHRRDISCVLLKKNPAEGVPNLKDEETTHGTQGTVFLYKKAGVVMKRYDRKGQEANERAFQRDIQVMQALDGAPHFPRLHGVIPTSLSMVTEYCGEKLSAANAPADWHHQLASIFHTLRGRGVNKMDPGIENFTVKDDTLYLVDMGGGTDFTSGNFQDLWARCLDGEKWPGDSWKTFLSQMN